ncbi:MAG: hypothetical protein ABIL16_06040 [candidate division WOR-3 bacterium]
MITVLLAGSNTPPWLGGPNILYAGIYGYGFAAYESRTVESYSTKGDYITRGLGGQSANLGGGAFIRWNQLGIYLDFVEGYFYSWNYQNEEIKDTSFYQRIGVDITWHINNESWTGIGGGIRNVRYALGYGFPFPDTSSNEVKEGKNLPIPNSNVKFMAIGLQGKYYLEAEKLYYERKGLLPWIGGYVGYAQASFEAGEPFNTSSDASSFYVEVMLGLDFYVQPWLSFWISGKYTTFETFFPLPPSHKYKDYYDNVRTSLGTTLIQGGIRLTFARERY